MFDYSSILLEKSSSLHYLLILVTIWITYSYVIFRSGFVSDDIQGIELFDGTLNYPVDLPNGDVERDAKGQVVKRRKITYGTLSKWVRYHICGGHFPSRFRYTKPDGTKGDFIPSGKLPRNHHLLSVIIQSIACLLTYQFLLLITTPMVALMTILLFIVHPTCLQAVAWPSAIGYILSLICISASLLIGHWTMNHLDIYSILLGTAGVIFFQIWGVYAQAIPLATWTIFALLGYWPMAIVSLIVSSAAAFYNLGGYVSYRKVEFKKQHMEHSTLLNIRKPIVVLKTIAYYIYLACWPARLGLYHQWGFHYDKSVERFDWRAAAGLIVVASACFLSIHGGIVDQIGFIWFFAFIFLFLNWITAQQWVTERYLYIPVIGLCLLASTYLPIWIYLIAFGMLLSRTLCHVSTYDNEIRFYQSNVWNFPKSEVAHGNLGVAYATSGLGGAANDNWLLAGHLNPDYDVPFYNLFSKSKTNGFMMIQNGLYEQGFRALEESIPMVEKVLQCKVLHFPEAWTKERDELIQIVKNPINFLLNELNRLTVLKDQLNNELKQTTDTKRLGELVPSVNNTDEQINRLISYLKVKGVQVEFNPEKALLSRVFQKR